MVKKLVWLACLALIVGAPAYARVVEVRILTGADDMEEKLEANNIDGGSSDLELAYENTNKRVPQLVALRYLVPLPKGAQIINAYVEWTVDETKGGTEAVNLVIDGQLTPNAPAFTTAAKNLSGRTDRTAAKVKWAVETVKSLKGASATADISSEGQKLKTPDLTSILQELLNQDGWASGNALVLFFADDPENPSTGLRCFDSFEGGANLAPRLYIEVFVGQATNPDPADGAPAVTLPLLTWTAGDSAVSHNVYFGTSPELTAANLVAPGQPVPVYYYALPLEPGVTYYWRVDEVDAAGTVYTGNVWQFTAEPVTAWGPNPADGATNVVPAPTLSWMAGRGAVEHQVFLSRSRFNVAAGLGDANQGKTAETKLATGLLALGATYYWRVDEIQPDGKAIKGPVWSFKTAEALEIRIATGSDDAEEHLVENPRMDLTSSDLEMPNEDWNAGAPPSTDPQLVGMRWILPLGKDAVVKNAYIEFLLSELKGNMDPVNLIIEGQLDPNPPTFTTEAKNISNRPRTKAQVKWTVPTGLAVLEKFQTPDLSPILNELLGQEGWAAGNAIVIMVRDDPDNPSTGIRNAESYNTQNGTRAPLLHVEFLSDQAAEPGPTVVWVSFHGADDAPSNNAKGNAFTEAPDKGYTDLLKANGYDVVRYIQTGTPDPAILSAADLVIISRSVGSGSFQNAAASRWNKIAAPIINVNGYTIRKNRLGFSTGNTIPDTVGDIALTVKDPNHPIFAGIALIDGVMANPFAGVVKYPTDGTLARGISIVTEPVNANGTLLATVAAPSGTVPAGAPVIAEWPAGVTVTHDGGDGTDTLAGRRLVFLTGSREPSGKHAETAGLYDLHEDGAKMFLNAVKHMLP